VLRDARRRSALTVALGVVAAVVAACTTSKPPAPPPVIPEVTTTTAVTLPDLSGFSIPPIAGATTVPAIGITPGQATLGGSVTDDTGAAVPGATVLLERIVGSSVAQATVASRADGSWVASGVGGGIYRVRAWRAPDLSQTDPAVVFVGATATQTVNLVVDHFTGLQLESSIAPSPPILGEPAEIAVQVTGSTVGSDGIVRSAGQGGVQVELFGEGEWTISSNPTTLTSSSGVAAWQGTCEALGPQPLSVLVNTTQSFPLSIPACIPVPPTTTTTSTTTTVAGHGATTTTVAKKP
jgi:hypothetical protein